MMTRALATRMWGMRGNPRTWQGPVSQYQHHPPPSRPLQTTKLGNILMRARQGRGMKPSFSQSWDLFHVGSWYGGDKVLGFYQFIDGHEWLIKLASQKNRQEIGNKTTKSKSLFYWLSTVRIFMGGFWQCWCPGSEVVVMTLFHIIYSDWRFCWCIYSYGDQGRRKWLFDGELCSWRPPRDLRQWETTFA